jgi:hypothetical protein
MNLLTIGDICRLLENAGVSDYTIERNRLLGFTMDYSIILGQSENTDR